MTAVRDLSIGQRLAAGFGLLFVLIAAFVAIVHYWHARSLEAQERFARRIEPLAHAAQDLESTLLRAGIAVRAHLLEPDATTRQARDQRLGAVLQALERLRVLPKEDAGEERYLRLAPLVARYVQTAGRVAQDAISEAALAQVRQAAVVALNDFSALQRRNADQALVRMQAASDSAARAFAIAGGLALVLFGVLALFIARSVREPAQALLGVAGALEAGDWRPALAWSARRQRGKRALRDEMLRLGQAFGAAAAALERREQRLRADRAVAGAAGTSLDKGEIAAAGLRAMCEHVGAEVGAFYWRTEDSLEPVARRALDGTLGRLRLGEGIPGQAAAEQRIVVVRDIPPDSPFSVRLGYDAAPPRCVAALPVAFRGELLGVLLVASLRELDGDALAFLDAAAGQLAIGLENAKAYEKIRELLAELAQKSGLLQAQNEDLQAQTEEIQAQNEELQAQSEEIQAQNEELKGQAQQLQQYADSVAEADKRKGEFLGILAHELRNPMAAIANSLYTLANSPRDEHRGRAQEVIGRQTRLLTRLVDDLLDVTRIASGKVRLQKEPTDLVEVVAECAEDYRLAAEKADLRLDIALPTGEMVVEGDRTRLCQIVGNLLDNAIKFGGSGGRVAVTLHALETEALLVVADTGIGMDAQMMERLFQPFSQADTSIARRKSGLGLGLALTKALAELHGGSIEARSDGPGRGSELRVRLPLAAQAPATARAAVRRPAAAPGRARRILIVEDNVDAAATLKDAMELAGHEARIAYDGEEALAAAREFHPEVVLCDIGLPGMDGYSVARTLRTDARFKSVFMIAVTGYAGPDDQERAAQAGFDRHFRKPPDIDLLCELLNDAPAGASRDSREAP